MPLTAAPCPVPSIPFAVLPTAAAAAAAADCPSGRPAYRHVLSRFGFGAIPADDTGQFDPDVWWSNQVDLGRRVGPYGGVAGLTAAYPTLVLDAAGTKAWLQSNTGNVYGFDAMNHLGQATLCLQAFSTAQLLETLTDVFSNHLNVPNGVSAVSLTRATYDRDVIRANAFGDFASMLKASARSVAMQSYLSLGASSGSGPNENYGRELLELHTVGGAAGYTQTDVVNAARVFTGRSQDVSNAYAFVPTRHWVGPVNVLSWSAQNSSAGAGDATGDDLLMYLARHPATASNVARKLCVRFVSDTPSDALVAAVARAYLDNDTAIVPTVSTIFRSTEFWAARNAKMRRPLENFIAAVRMLGLTPISGSPKTTGAALQWMAASAGQSPLAWPSPDGYPDVAAAWRSEGNIAALWGLHLGLTGKYWTSSFGPYPTNYLYGTTTPATSGQGVDAMSDRLLGGPLTPTQRAAVFSYLNEVDSTPMASSKLRAEATNVAALLLHAPQHAIR